MVVKLPGEKHFTRRWGGDLAWADRLILPSLDRCPVKVTDFTLIRGFSPGRNIVHETDEIVYILKGEIELTAGGNRHVLKRRGSYYTPAGTPTTVRARRESRLLCIFFIPIDGRVPNDE